MRPWTTVASSMAAIFSAYFCNLLLKTKIFFFSSSTWIAKSALRILLKNKNIKKKIRKLKLHSLRSELSMIPYSGFGQTTYFFTSLISFFLYFFLPLFIYFIPADQRFYHSISFFLKLRPPKSWWRGHSSCLKSGCHLHCFGLSGPLQLKLR